MDHNWLGYEPMPGFQPQTRRSLSVDSLLQQQHISGTDENVEAIELATGISSRPSMDGGSVSQQDLDTEPSNLQRNGQLEARDRSDEHIDNNDEQLDTRVQQPVRGPSPDLGTDEQLTQPSHEEPTEQDEQLLPQPEAGRVSDDVVSQQQTQPGQQARPPEGNGLQTHAAPASTAQSWVKPGRKRARLLGCAWVGDWIWEIVSLLVAVCCLVAIFTILAQFDDKEQPEWPYASTLNLSTLIALLATVLRSMLENVLGAGKSSHPDSCRPWSLLTAGITFSLPTIRDQPSKMAMVRIVVAKAQPYGYLRIREPEFLGRSDLFVFASSPVSLHPLSVGQYAHLFSIVYHHTGEDRTKTITETWQTLVPLSRFFPS